MKLKQKIDVESIEDKSKHIELERRNEIVQPNQQNIEIISAKINEQKRLSTELQPLWLEVLQGLFKAWQESFGNNTQEGHVHSPKNTIFLLKPWIVRLLKMDILSKPNHLQSIEKHIPGTIRVCAESLNDYAVALSELRPLKKKNLHQASEFIALSRQLLDRKIYESNQRLIEQQIESLEEI